MKNIFDDLSIKYEKTRTIFAILKNISHKRNNKIPSTLRTPTDRNIHF